ncbi:MAG: HK97 family phage prohead protease [Caulobacteraceae bacterium]|nr:HK97 family phage prohead protease [Caulobacteraceae bacterium]
MIETRLAAVSIDAGRLIGYASVYGPLSEDLGGFRERVAPTAFERSLESGSDVRALVNHDSTLVLGRRQSGTLLLQSDQRGLLVTIRPPETQYASDLLRLIERGDVSQMSFGFHVRRDSWEQAGHGRTRVLEDVDLVEVSVVTIPAYPDTSVAIRSRDRWSRHLERVARVRALVAGGFRYAGSR